MRYEPKLSGLGQNNNCRFTLVTGWYYPFYTSYTELNALPFAGIISGTLISCCCPAPPAIQLEFGNILKSLSF
jgi:hypothetical protein